VITLSLLFPNFDPVAVQLGPFAIRWYALAYITGIVLGWRYALRLIAQPPRFMNRLALDDFIVWVTLGVILGGRLGYVLFYKPSYYFANPIEIVQVWHGGMSFHGGLIGVLTAIYLFARRRGLPVLALGDVVAAVAPIGLFFGRLANFVNGELFGRPTDVAWGMIFPNDPEHLPRHPSQLYEATFEGLLLFLVMLYFANRPDWRERPGRVGGVFLTGYAIARMSGELFREPDSFLGFIIGPFTMGQLLSLPLLIAGIYLTVSGARRDTLPDKPVA
jgi:phosphatidylglycerol---prolipoprotein diacylglyceryl transferase